MKIFFLTFLFALPAWSSVCHKSYGPADNRGIQNAKSCTLSWNHENQEHHIEIVFAKNACQRMEGSDFEDCFFARTCSDQIDGPKFVSAPQFLDAPYLDQYCEFSKPQLRMILGANDETPRSPASATIECKDKKAIAIILKTPSGKSKNCPIP